MGFFNMYPYINYNDLNLDALLGEIKKVVTDMEDFKVVNSIRFYGIHDITKSYPSYSIVDKDGNGYISKKPVPVGVDLDNEDYWVLVANYSQLFADVENRVVALEGSQAEQDTKIADHTELIEALEFNKLDKYFGFWFMPESYGAIGDGITDDTEAIQAMFDAMPNSSQCVFSKKEYLITAPIEVNKSFLTICGGFGSNSYGATIKTNEAIDILHLNYQGCSIMNLKLTGARSSDSVGTPITLCGIKIQPDVGTATSPGIAYNADAWIRGCTIYGCKTGIEIAGINADVYDSLISSCSTGILFRQLADTSIRTGTYNIKRNRFHHCIEYGVRSNLKHGSGKEIVVDGNICDISKTFFYGGCGNLFITNNKYFEPQYDGYRCVELLGNATVDSDDRFKRYNVIANNEFIGGFWASNQTGKSGVGILVNQPSGDYSRTPYLIIQGNKLTNHANAAIYCQQNVHCECLNNVIRECTMFNASFAPITFTTSTYGNVAYNDVQKGANANIILNGTQTGNLTYPA